MYRPSKVLELIELSESGQFPPRGDLNEAEGVIGFSFGLLADEYGLLKNPGPVNEALADFITNDEILREKPMILQEELAMAVIEKDRLLADNIQSVKSIKRPWLTYNTHEIIQMAKPELITRKIGRLAVIAFRYHLPRAEAQVRKAGYETIIPDLRNVGDFDPNSSQKHTSSPEEWAKREKLSIMYHALLNRI